MESWENKIFEILNFQKEVAKQEITQSENLILTASCYNYKLGKGTNNQVARIDGLGFGSKCNPCILPRSN